MMEKVLNENCWYLLNKLNHIDLVALNLSITSSVGLWNIWFTMYHFVVTVTSVLKILTNVTNFDALSRNEWRLENGFSESKREAEEERKVNANYCPIYLGDVPASHLAHVCIVAFGQLGKGYVLLVCCIKRKAFSILLVQTMNFAYITNLSHISWRCSGKSPCTCMNHCICTLFEFYVSWDTMNVWIKSCARCYVVVH